jgi:hypothetical protein
LDTVPWYTLPCYGETLTNRVVSILSHVGKKHREPDQKKSDSAKKDQKAEDITRSQVREPEVRRGQEELSKLNPRS